MPGRNFNDWIVKLAPSGPLGCPMSTNESFEQRVAGKSVGAMKTSAGHFTHRVQTYEVCFSVDCREHPATLVVSRRHDRNRFTRDIDPILEAGLIDVGEPIDDKLGGLMGDIQEHVIRAALFHFTVDRPGD